jgi:hypothetical protein
VGGDKRSLEVYYLVTSSKYHMVHGSRSTTWFKDCYVIEVKVIVQGCAAAILGYPSNILLFIIR